MFVRLPHKLATVEFVNALNTERPGTFGTPDRVLGNVEFYPGGSIVLSEPDGSEHLAVADFDPEVAAAFRTVAAKLDTPIEHAVPGLKPVRYKATDQWDTDAVLCLAGRRFGLGFVGPQGTSRREYGGPIVPGPYAYTFGLATVLAADPAQGTGAEMGRLRHLGMVIDARPGELLVFLVESDQEHRFTIEIDRYNDPRLIQVVES
jgi:hypothetical protein